DPENGENAAVVAHGWGAGLAIGTAKLAGKSLIEKRKFVHNKFSTAPLTAPRAVTTIIPLCARMGA
ncbi:MAG: hypothetical protein RIE56_03445, partial [Amphiplicatus sp.]